MKFSIVMGIPDMLEYWNSLQEKNENGTSTKDETKTYKLLHNTFKKISNDPKYPGLHTHEIDELTARYGFKVFQSYCENHNPKAMRVYWVYGPEKSTTPSWLSSLIRMTRNQTRTKRSSSPKREISINKISASNGALFF